VWLLDKHLIFVVVLNYQSGFVPEPGIPGTGKGGTCYAMH
jgi:hypothetical protein